ncbi:MAG: 1-deoxy-D-xylulose 5-phosphate reductoisomerase [Oscillospiraceae bacterium]|jgi:1-deoxy-D-xylulose-5-phosphate reductoisomerase|nr:1-deoxy-D-xylulose 5-phosphate reductoisomerase [Oscillospiraceae bacterium]
MKTISVLGSTGSIGIQALEVARMHNIKIKALSGNKNVKLLEKQAREFLPEYVCVYDQNSYKDLKERLFDTDIKVISGMDGLCKAASLDGVDMMLNSVVGMVGLLPTLSAVEKKIPVALANKETLVAGGNIVMNLAKEKNTPIIPVDSEHSAIFQCLQGNDRKDLNKIILTASGGPFYGKKKHELENVGVKDALNHPNWNMGNKITIDSATLMNKGLEFIEAKWLFDLEPSQIEVVVHRQSILHSAVEYKDFSIIAQLGMPDMKIPIQYALLYPKRLPSPAKRLSLTECGALTFEKPDYATFECLSACILAIKKGGIYPCVVNAANEAAVEQFLNGKVSFLKISELVIKTMEKFPYSEPNSYSDIENADKAAREYAISLI